MLQFGIIALFGAIAGLDLPRLIRERNKRGLFVYSLVLGLAFIISELHLYHFKIMSPNRMITGLVRFFTG
ncbi:MAG: hypothetical protein K0S39_1309 [Paenibacillus sp.]|jgi:DMSO reductase anchor subunit|nr:hypothetical protein [Paenibacillus sp.]